MLVLGVRMCMVRGCGSRVRLRHLHRGVDNLTQSQVHFPRVSVVLHTTLTAVHVCVHPVRQIRQLAGFQ